MAKVLENMHFNSSIKKPMLRNLPTVKQQHLFHMVVRLTPIFVIWISIVLGIRIVGYRSCIQKRKCNRFIFLNTQWITKKARVPKDAYFCFIYYTKAFNCALTVICFWQKFYITRKQ